MNPNLRRRLIGGFALGLAIAMLILGQTLLVGKLSPIAFIFYWLGCFLLTTVAVLVALADARATAARTLKEQRELLDSTLTKIQSEARNRPNPRHNGGKEPEP